MNVIIQYLLLPDFFLTSFSVQPLIELKITCIHYAYKYLFNNGYYQGNGVSLKTSVQEPAQRQHIEWRRFKCDTNIQTSCKSLS